MLTRKILDSTVFTQGQIGLDGLYCRLALVAGEDGRFVATREALLALAYPGRREEGLASRVKELLGELVKLGAVKLERGPDGAPRGRVLEVEGPGRLRLVELPSVTESRGTELAKRKRRRYSETFERWWSTVWPKTARRGGKDAAFRAWKRRAPRVADEAELLELSRVTVAAWAETEDWRRGFAPMAATFINRGDLDHLPDGSEVVMGESGPERLSDGPGAAGATGGDSRVADGDGALRGDSGARHDLEDLEADLAAGDPPEGFGPDDGPELVEGVR